MRGEPSGVPRTLLHNLKHNRVVHERVIFLTILTEPEPHVPDEQRLAVTELSGGFWRVVARFGFMEAPNVPAILAESATHGLDFRPMETSYFLGRETIISSEKPGMARWRERLFALMTRNASPATAYFGLPPNRVVELGAQVEI
jgi:KUP system potassium uptake protein